MTGGQVSSRAQLFLAAQQLITSSPATGLVALGWKPSPDPNAAGYLLCWGYAAGQCTSRLDVGDVTNTSVAGLSLGQSYWFSVVAYDSASRESVPSNEITYQPPMAARPAAPPTLSLVTAQSGGGGKVPWLSFQGQAGVVYEVQATTDFQRWDSILTTNSPVAGLVLLPWQDTSRYSRRFYRLRLLPAGSLPALPRLSVTRKGSGTAAPVLRLSFQGAAGSTYEIQATSDFQQWNVIWTTNSSASGVVTYDLSPAMNKPRQFFRLASR